MAGLVSSAPADEPLATASGGKTADHFRRVTLYYELRSYDIVPEKLDEYLNWANSRALPVLVGVHGFRLVGFWRVVQQQGAPVSETNVHWLIAWQSEAEMNERWAKARASAEWLEVIKEATDPQGNMIYHKVRRSTLLQGIPRSPLQ